MVWCSDVHWVCMVWCDALYALIGIDLIWGYVAWNMVSLLSGGLSKDTDIIEEKR